MSANGPEVVRPDTRFFDKNRYQFPLNELVKYAGRTIAWTPDGTRIVANGPDFLTLWNQFKAQGINPSEFVYEDIPPLDAESSLL